MTEESPKTEKTPRRDISRLTATLIIAGVILAVALGALYHQTRLPDNHPFKKCETLFGMDDMCKGFTASDMLVRGY